MGIEGEKVRDGVSLGMSIIICKLLYFSQEYGFSTRIRTSRSRSPSRRPHQRGFRSPSPSTSLPPSSSPKSVLLDISRNQREILRQNRDLHDRLAIVEVRHV